jgi:hypothetical protein
METLLAKLLISLNLLSVAIASFPANTVILTPPQSEEISVIQLVEKYIPKEFKEVSLRIIKAESNFKEKAKNPKSSAKGLSQIIDGTWKHYGCSGDPLIGEENIVCMAQILKRDGTRPWTSSARAWDTQK